MIEEVGLVKTHSFSPKLCYCSQDACEAHSTELCMLLQGQGLDARLQGSGVPSSLLNPPGLPLE